MEESIQIKYSEWQVVRLAFQHLSKLLMDIESNNPILAGQQLSSKNLSTEPVLTRHLIISFLRKHQSNFFTSKALYEGILPDTKELRRDIFTDVLYRLAKNENAPIKRIGYDEKGNACYQYDPTKNDYTKYPEVTITN